MKKLNLEVGLIDDKYSREAFIAHAFGSRYTAGHSIDKFLKGDDVALHPSYWEQWQAFKAGIKFWQSVEDARFNNV